MGQGSASDVCAAGKLCTFLHGEYLGLDVAIDLGLVLQLATLGSDFPFDLAVNFHFTGSDIALDDGIFTNGHAALVRSDFAVDFSIDDHVVGEADGTGDFDSAGEHVCRIGHDEDK